jgi:hypothetical protein
MVCRRGKEMDFQVGQGMDMVRHRAPHQGAITVLQVAGAMEQIDMAMTDMVVEVDMARIDTMGPPQQPPGQVATGV